MRAVCWHGHGDVRVDNVPDPIIQHPRDAIIKITACAICGSDLHLYDGYQPTMKSGDILGHENMGVVIEVGSEVKNLRVGDRVVVPFTISCGQCWFCQKGMFSACERTNPNAELAIKAMGHSPAGLFGFSHMLGGYSGGQAEYLRVPMADVGPIKIPDQVTDEQALFLSDIFPTGYMAAENCNIQKGDTVMVFGCGPVGQFAIKSAFLLGAGRVIAVDTVPERMELARKSGAELLDYSDKNLQQNILDITGGKGPDCVIEAVGLESHGHGGVMETVKTKMTSMERPLAFEQAILACRPGGTVSLPGVFINAVTVPMGAVVAKGLTVKTGQTHVQRYLEPLMKRIEEGEIDPSFLITHRITLEEGPEAYKTFRDKKDGCIKVVIHPNG